MNHSRIPRCLFAAIALMVCLTPLLPALEEGEEAAAARTYDSNEKVYCDALWLRVHTEDCPLLFEKEKRKTMTLEEADKAGYRLGEQGQSGRSNCCLVGYKRKHPAKTISDDAIFYGNDLKKNFKHLPGCHRYWPSSADVPHTKKEWEATGFTICGHCIERGPSLITVDVEAWKKLYPNPFVAPEGWQPKPLPVDKLPPKQDLDLLVEQLLGERDSLVNLQFTNPLASVEHFMIIRYFFGGYQLHKAYRATGDKRLLDKMLESARHYHKLATEYPSAAQFKARDPEGMPFMYPMAAWARITLQLARKKPSVVSKQELAEAEAFLKNMVSVLKPTWENDALDPDMGIPQKLANDFRSRAFNRAMNGIGTLSLIAVALEDLQTLKTTKEYQPTIDRYRTIIQEYIKNWWSVGHFCDKVEGQKLFVYPYAASGDHKMVDGCKVYKRAEDTGHYSHTMQGVFLLYESVPELGIDDEFMTAVANAVYRSLTVKVEVQAKGKKVAIMSGHVECPTQARVQPTTRAGDKGHVYSAAPERHYMLEAFRDGMIDALCITLDASKKNAVNSDFDHRTETLLIPYLKALRKDRSLIHLGEKQ
jgi:hypothetical protein